MGKVADRLKDPELYREQAKRFAFWANPVTGAPSAALESVAAVDAYGPSMMPRSSMHQGMAAGLSILAGRIVGTAVEWGTLKLVGRRAPLTLRLGARAAIAAAGAAAMRIPEKPDESMYVSTARSMGNLAMAGALGAAAYDVGIALRERFPARRAVRPLATAALGSAALGVLAQRKLQTRRELIQRWTEEDKPAALMGSVGIGWVVTTVGIGLGKGFIASRKAAIAFFGDDPTHQAVARVVNAAGWAAGAMVLYNMGVAYIGRANEKVEPAYATPPNSPLVSGSPESLSPFEDLGLQGRRYVSDVVTPDLIEEVMGEPAKAHPIRTFVGFNSEPIYASGRAELALNELARTGAFDRSYLLLVSPTGTGWVDQTMIESAEFLTRGDIATCCIQYARYPSFLSVQKVALGRTQFRQLLWGVSQRLAERPPEKRPKVLVFGESLGAWSSSDVLMYQGIYGFDHYGIDRALWVGLPGLAKWSRTGMRRGSGKLVPEGTVSAFDNFDELAKLTPEDRERLRAVVLDHDNDPIAVISPDLLVRRPDWLRGDRGRNVPDSMDWIPAITFVHIAVDAMNAMRTVPGEFKSFGHDYRKDMARFVYAAYRLPEMSEEQLQSVEWALRTLELERGERIKAAKAEDAPPPPSLRDELPEAIGGIPLRRRTKGARWVRRRASAEPAEA